MGTQTAQQDLQRWLVDTVEMQDRDRYLCSMLLPPEHRYSVLCVLAFHAEVARIRESVTESTMGYIRLQWWYDSLEQQDAVLGSSPIVRCVLDLPMFSELRPYLFQMLDARYRDQSRQRFASVAEAEAWVEYTTAPLVNALACAAGVPELVASVALRNALKAHGLIGLLRSSKAMKEIGQPLWSSALETGEDRRNLAKQVLPKAEAAIQMARQHQSEVRSPAFALLLHASLAEQHMHTLKKAGYDIFDPRFTGPSRMTLRILWNWIWRKI